MEESIGLRIVEVVLVKTDLEIIKKLCKRLKKDEVFVRKLMRYNVWTIKQFADISGLGISTITNLARPMDEGDGQIVYRLNYCFPFQDSEGRGPKYIVRDEKSEKYIKL
jgi:hypothetical protein